MGDLSPEAKYSDILILNGIKNKISKVEISVPQDIVGAHFGSICEAVTITFEDNPEKCHLFVKKMLPISDPGQLETFGSVMLKEGYFLTTLRNNIKALCTEKLGPNSDLEHCVTEMFPKTFVADKEAIVLEDLIQKGFKMVKKPIKQDFDHAKLVLSNLAKLHGVTSILIQESGGKAKLLENTPELTDWFLKSEAGVAMSGMFKSTVEAMFKILKESDVRGSSELLSKLKKYQGKWFKSIVEVLRLDSIFPVINHGDCWNNNMMFTYSDNGVVQENILYDLQGSRVGSPAADLGYYLYTSVDVEARRQLKPLLQFYFNELGNTVKMFGNELPMTFEEFLKEFGKVSKLGVMFGFIMGIGLDSMKDVDTDSGDSTALFSNPDYMRNLVDKWVANNPDKMKEIAHDLVRLAQDYEEVGTL